MDDKSLMENLLLLEKGGCDLFLHGTVESSTERVKGVFHAALTESLTMQGTLYGQMAMKGWYPAASAETTQIKNVKDKYKPSMT